jgi:hypothetical protein
LSHAVGQLQQTIGRDQPRFGMSADRSCAIGDAVAGLEIGDTTADFLDHASRFTPEPAWQCAG